MDRTPAAPLTRYVDAAILGFILIFSFATTFTIAVTQIAYFTALALWIFKTVHDKKLSVRSTPLDYFFLTYIVVETISAFFAYYPPQAWLIWQKRILLIPIVYLLATHLKSEAHLRWSVVAFLASALGVALYGVYTVIRDAGLFFAFEERLELFQYPLTASGIMMYAMLLALAFLVHPSTPRRYRIVSLFALAPMVINLVFTFSRSSWLGFVGGAILIAVVRAKKLIYALAAAVILFGLFASPQMKERAFSSFNPYHPSNTPRLEMWKVGINIFVHNPWIGIGDIGIERVYPLYAPPGTIPEGHLHNNLVMWAATTGGVGLLLLVSLFARLFLAQWKVYTAVRERWFYGSIALGIVASGVAFHINGLFEWNFGDAEIITIIWMMSAWSFVVNRLAVSEAGGASVP